MNRMNLPLGGGVLGLILAFRTNQAGELFSDMVVFEVARFCLHVLLGGGWVGALRAFVLQGWGEALGGALAGLFPPRIRRRTLRECHPKLSRVQSLGGCRGLKV